MTRRLRTRKHCGNGLPRSRVGDGKSSPQRLANHGAVAFTAAVQRDARQAQQLLPYRESARHSFLLGYELIRQAVTGDRSSPGVERRCVLAVRRVAEVSRRAAAHRRSWQCRHSQFVSERAVRSAVLARGAPPAAATLAIAAAFVLSRRRSILRTWNHRGSAGSRRGGRPDSL